MINTLYKPKGSRIWRLKFRLQPADGKITDVSLGTADKQVAERRRSERLRELEHERSGIIPPKAARESAHRKLSDHLDDFLGDLRRRGKSEKHLANLEFRVSRLIGDCSWNLPMDVTADSFQAWRRRQQELSDKTVNDYLEAVRSLFNWLMRFKRIASNPLDSVEKVKTKEGAALERRALSDDEMLRLREAAPERWPVYLMAAHTGLRRSELAALRWSDLELSGEMPCLRVRASTSKNGKAAAMRVHPELVELLRNLRSQISGADEPLFVTVPRIERFYRDLKKAGIPLHDAQGRKVVFHSLRKTFGTNLAKAGVASRTAMTLMRHSDRRLTDRIYTDENLLATAEAFDVLPNYAERASQIASQKLGAEGQNGAFPGTTRNGVESSERSENTQETCGNRPILAYPPLAGNGGSGGARTRNLCRDRAAL